MRDVRSAIDQQARVLPHRSRAFISPEGMQVRIADVSLRLQADIQSPEIDFRSTPI
jgi:hypothetical protein